MCTLPGCDKKTVARGYCTMHYQRWRTYGDPGEPEPRKVSGQTTCRVEGCGSQADSRHLCFKHYKRWQMFGDEGITRISERDPEHMLSYRGAHRRVEAERGAAGDYPCQECGKRASEWAYNHEDEAELHGYHGNHLMAFSLSPNFYVPMCVPCHRAFDKEKRTNETHDLQ